MILTLNSLGKDDNLTDFSYLSKLDKKAAGLAFEDMMIASQHYSLVMLHFQIENFFRNLWCELSNEKLHRLSNLIEKLLNYLQFEDVNQKKQTLATLLLITLTQQSK